MTKSKEYWTRRMEILEEAQHKRGAEYLQDLDVQYRKASKEIEKQLSVWYQRFAKNNSVSMAEARKMLKAKELAELKWDLAEYIKYGKKNAVNQFWVKELENASARVHISRLEAIQLQLQQQIEVLYGNQVDEIDGVLREIYENGYYHTAYEVQKGLNVGWSFQALDQDKLSKILSKPWTMDNKTFSGRIWGNKTRLLAELQTELAQSVIMGKSPEKMIGNIAKKLNVSRRQAGRLVMTESAAISSAAQQDAFKELDVERYEIVATLDSRTSEICRSMDGQVFEMKYFQVGVTAPPFHPWCRTTTAPYFDDEFATGSRAARGLDGKTYFIPSDMTFPEWKSKFVSEEGFAILQKMNKNQSFDKDQYARYSEIVGFEEVGSFDNFRDIKYNNSVVYGEWKREYRKLNRYQKIIKHEPAITSDLKDIAGTTGTELVGLDFRLKSKKSYLRKVNFESDNSKDLRVIDDTIAKTNDVIRYTFQTDSEHLVEKYFEIQEQLTEKGYQVTKVKNYWLVKGNPYNGINCNYKDLQGQGFEIQYHTPESFALKNSNLHELYEEWRVIENKASEEAVRLTKEMYCLSNDLEVPLNIKAVR